MKQSISNGEYEIISSYSTAIVFDKTQGKEVPFVDVLAQRLHEKCFDPVACMLSLSDNSKSIAVVYKTAEEIKKNKETYDVVVPEGEWSVKSGKQFFENVLDKTSHLCAEEADKLYKKQKKIANAMMMNLWPSPLSDKDLARKKVTAYDGFESGVRAMFNGPR